MRDNVQNDHPIAMQRSLSSPYSVLFLRYQLLDGYPHGGGYANYCNQAL